jgi:S1-C subfamily serine protease
MPKAPSASFSLPSLSDALASLVESAAPSVVRVESARRPVSGTVVGPDLVVSAAHAVPREGSVAVTAADGTEWEAEVLGRDPSTDLALLRLPAGAAAQPVTWAEGDAPRTGSLVVALGRPGRGIRATLGMISGVGPAWRSPGGTEIDRYIEVDGGLPPGGSGGPLLDASGAALGIDTALLVRGGTTIPASTVRHVVERLQQPGGMRRGRLGAAVQAVDLKGEQAVVAGQDRALLVLSLEDGGPAETAGLRASDLILALDGQSVAGYRDLLARLAERPDAGVSLRVLRGASVEQISVKLGSREPRAACC